MRKVIRLSSLCLLRDFVNRQTSRYFDQFDFCRRLTVLYLPAGNGPAPTLFLHVQCRNSSGHERRKETFIFVQMCLSSARAEGLAFLHKHYIQNNKESLRRILITLHDGFCENALKCKRVQLKSIPWPPIK